MKDVESEILIASIESITEAINKVSGEITHARAWETILLLLVTRYYNGKENGIALLQKDRDFLSGSWKKFGRDREVAEDIEQIYETILSMVRSESSQDVSEDPVEYTN